jgi:catechol 2,3-dioxygenase-like lactoylglutathione lyase family enzyme
MSSNGKVVAFVATKDSVRARKFYEGVLELRIVHEDEFALVVDANGTPLRITKVRDMVVAPYTVLGWEVSDVVARVKTLQARGVSFERYDFLEQDPLGTWTAPSGARVAWFKDPDGNVLSLSQAEERA